MCFCVFLLLPCVFLVYCFVCHEFCVVLVFCSCVRPGGVSIFVLLWLLFCVSDPSVCRVVLFVCTCLLSLFRLVHPLLFGHVFCPSVTLSYTMTGHR